MARARARTTTRAPRRPARRQAHAPAARPVHAPAVSFGYVCYIRSTPDKVWNALVAEDVTRQYWGHRNVSDWQPGSRWEHRRVPGDTVDLVGTVLESRPPYCLEFTWALPQDVARAARTSRVRFELSPRRESVRLALTHDRLQPAMRAAVAEGWPAVLSSLKTLLETGRALPGPG